MPALPAPVTRAGASQEPKLRRQRELHWLLLLLLLAIAGGRPLGEGRATLAMVGPHPPSPV